jgi:hypothetical protein
MNLAVCLLVGLTSLSTPEPQTVSVSASLVLPENGVKVGDPFRLVIEASHPTGGIALVPESLPLPEALAELSDQRRHLRTQNKEQETDRYEIELIAFETGDFEIPALEIAYSATVAKTQKLLVSVGTDLSEQEQAIASSTLAQAMGELEKMAAPNPVTRDIMIEDFTPLYVLGGLLFALIAFFVGRWLYRKYQQSKEAQIEAAPPPPPRPAHEVAFERLELLRTSEYLQNDDYKAYFVELSEILRGYVGGRYDFDSVELTVYELIATLRSLRTPGLDLAQLERMLNDADFVKFAKYLPSDTEAHSALNGAFEMVEKTAKKEVPSDAAI